MGDKSTIEWTDATWNPATGCTKVSPGCAHCYIERTPPFRVNHRQFDAKGSIPIQLHPERLTQPLHWKRPRRVFVNSLSDLFHEDIPFDFIDRVFAVMALTPQHTYQILTKRPGRMREFVLRLWKDISLIQRVAREMGHTFMFEGLSLLAWPLSNVWLGVTAENQHFADERIPLLLQTPAAVRFVSYEPALSELKLRWDWVSGGKPKPKLDWIIAGGESGPGARPMHPEWARSVLEQCQAAGVPFFMKQGSQANWEDFKNLKSFTPDLQVREYPEATK